MRNRAYSLLGILTVSCLSVGSLTPASADSGTEEAYEALVAIDARHAESSGKDVLTSLADVSISEHGETAVHETVSESEVLIPSTLEEPVTISEEGSTLAVTLPGAASSSEASAAAQGVVEFENSAGYSQYPLVKDDASVQFTTVISGPEAPRRYEYGIGDGDLTVEITPDGFAIFTDEEGEFAGASLPPWAQDSNGTAVPTHFESDGKNLRQVVNHTASNISYPVVADPYMGRNLIKKVSKSRYKGKPKYSVYKTRWGNTVARGHAHPYGEDPLLGAHIMRNQGWSEAVKKGTSKAKTIRQQYDCHTVYAAWKNPWNLERVRKTRGYWLINPWGCNW